MYLSESAKALRVPDGARHLMEKQVWGNEVADGPAEVGSRTATKGGTSRDTMLSGSSVSAGAFATHSSEISPAQCKGVQLPGLWIFHAEES